MTDTIDVLGVKIPIAKWGVGAFTLLALIGVGVIVWQKAMPTDLVSLRQANASMAFEVNEYGRHLTDKPEHDFTDSDGTLSLLVYNDHCVAIQRLVGKATQTRLIPDPSRVPVAASFVPEHKRDILPVAEAAGRCIEPHPGPAQASYGARNGCAVQVFWAYADGCMGVQWYNTCTGFFDVRPDGVPNIRWTRCVH